MAIDERRRLELADAVKRTLGDEAGLTLMEMLPPVGWADVATRQDPAREFDALRSEMNHRFDLVDQRFEALEHKLLGAFHQEMAAQTWRLVTAAAAMFGIFAAVVRL